MAKTEYVLAIRITSTEFKKLTHVANRLGTSPNHVIPHLIDHAFGLLCGPIEQMLDRSIPFDSNSDSASDSDSDSDSDEPTNPGSPASKKSSGSWRAVKPPYTT